ncbi:uncharacterized protein LOC117650758 [Thrips palmi]|uniref:Uncharacterized protein LOC117650758 n=1 Tax=Thrips palmi TaxID=161013 RepID=A0A6P8ZYN9_THRPL|nr:uncharacterized protein LOC117650758 [Thrips palmi]
MDAWLLAIFAAALNFTAEVRGTADGRRFGFNDNGTYTGSLRELVTGRADVAFNQHFVMDYNSGAVLPSAAVDFDALCVVVPLVGNDGSLVDLLRSVSGGVLLVFALTAATLIAVYWLISCHAPRRPHLQDSFFFMFAVLCGAPAVPLPRVCSQRVLIGFCALYSVVATNSFQSLASTDMAAGRGASKISTLEELDRSGLRTISGSDSLRTTTFQGDNPLLRRLLPKVFLAKDDDEYKQVTSTHQVAWMNRRNSAKPADSAWYVLPECPRQYFLAFLLPQSSPFLDPLNKVLYRLQSGGVLHFLRSMSYEFLMKREAAASAKGGGVTIPLQTLRVPLLMLCAGYSAAVIAVLGEIAAHRLAKRSPTVKPSVENSTLGPELGPLEFSVCALGSAEFAVFTPQVWSCPRLHHAERHGLCELLLT